MAKLRTGTKGTQKGGNSLAQDSEGTLPTGTTHDPLLVTTAVNRQRREGNTTQDDEHRQGPGGPSRGKHGSPRRAGCTTQPGNTTASSAKHRWPQQWSSKAEGSYEQEGCRPLHAASLPSNAREESECGRHRRKGKAASRRVSLARNTTAINGTRI